MEYSLVKKAIKDAIEQIVKNDSWNQEPVVVIDYHDWKAKKFNNPKDAESYLEEQYCDLGDWSNRELPFNGEEDEEIIIIKYCGGYLKNKHPYKYEDYKFYKKINGVNIYRKKVLANFKATVDLTVNI